MTRMLNREQAKAFYDRFGARQDSQAFYEDPATGDIIAHAAFERATAVFEFGGGTGRFAARLLAAHLSADCPYQAVDVSGTMVELATARIQPWAPRAEVRLTGRSTTIDAPDGSFDRFVANFVLDLLSDADIRDLLDEAHRLLMPGGLLCLACLTHGPTFLAGLMSRALRAVHHINPKLVGGCRPVELRDYLAADL